MSDISNFIAHLLSKGFKLDYSSRLLNHVWGTDSKEGSVVFVEQGSLNADSGFRFKDGKELSIIRKLETNSCKLKDLGLEVISGRTIGNSDLLIYPKDTLTNLDKSMYRKILRGRDVDKYGICNYFEFISIPKGTCKCGEDIITITNTLINAIPGLKERLEDKFDDYYEDAWFETPERGDVIKGCLLVRTSAKTKGVYVDNINYCINDAMKLVRGDLAKAYVAVFNSDIFDVLFRLYFATNSFKKDTVKDVTPMENMYLPKNLVLHRLTLEAYVDEMQMLYAEGRKYEFDKKLEEINDFVVSMYGLTKEDYLYLCNI